MKITVEAIDRLTHIDGVPVRVWEGATDRGVECLFFVYRIAVRSDADCSQFEAELREAMPPGRSVPPGFIFSAEAL